MIEKIVKERERVTVSVAGAAMLKAGDLT